MATEAARPGASSRGKYGEVARLERLEARSVWPREEEDLNLWLSENLDVLQDELGFGLELVEREHRVGRYELDLLLRSDDDRVVIVESQFGVSNHDHLGKLLAYAAGTQADVVVWLSESFTDEHAAAFQWMNDQTTEEVAFFAIALGAVRIGNSDPAPLLETVVRPNEWVRRTKPDRNRARRDLRDDFDRERYIEVGHDPDKVDLGLLIEKQLRSLTGWTAKHFKNQIALFDAEGKVLGIQFWTRDLRLSTHKFWADPSLDPFPQLAGRRTDSQEWYWFIRNKGEIPTNLEDLVKLVSRQSSSDERT